MLSTNDLKQKLLKRWNRGQILRAYLGAEELFPLSIPLGKPSSADLLKHFPTVQTWKAQLERHSRKKGTHGYTLEMVNINHRQVGRQQIPGYALFENIDDVALFIGKDNDIRLFERIKTLITTTHPALIFWLVKSPIKALEQESNWTKLLNVLGYFSSNPRPNKYLRELNIPTVDSKFIERHKALLTELLNIVLPAEHINAEITRLSHSGFERRFGLKYDEALVRFRVLDKTLLNDFACLDDLTLPLSRFRTLNPHCEHVFITENKINGLSFPPQSNSIVIFGLGYGISSLRDIGWLETKKISYWGDIDSHGFAILSQLRGYFPQTQSLLMTRKTLEGFRPLWVHEEKGKRTTANLPHLTEEEMKCYDLLRKDYFGECVRLEQERVSFEYVLKELGKV